MTDQLKPCPCCIDAEEQDLSMPTACDGIEYVVCQLCGLRVDAESWDYLTRIPEGFALVPIEPTVKMLKASVKTYEVDFFGFKSAWPSDIYKAMLKAAGDQHD